MIKVLRKVDDILRIVAEMKDKATLIGLSRKLKIHKATISHILKTMGELGYIEKSAAKCYSIGPRITELADRSRRRSILQEVAAEETLSLSEKLRETTSVSVIHNGIRHRITHASVNQSVTVAVDVSEESRGAPYDTATGRMLMAYLDRDNLSLVLKKNGFPDRRWNNMEHEKVLKKTLAEIRNRGLAFWHANDNQAEAIAVPIFGPDNRVWAALGVAVPAFRFRGKRREKIIRTLKSAGKEMSFNLALRYGEPEHKTGKSEKLK